MSRDYQGPYYSLDDLRSVIDAMCKSIESSGLIDEHEHPSAYSALLDTSKWMAELEGQEPVAWQHRNGTLSCRCPEGQAGAYWVPLYARPSPAEPVEMSPDFTDTARSALLWVLWHHQGGSSPVGQPIRQALGMDAHERLSERQVQEAKKWAAISGAKTNDFHRSEPVNARLLDALKLAECVYRKNVVNEGEPSSVLEAMQAAITAAEAQRQTDYSSTVDRAWARFCGAFGDGPDAPYPGMIASFEIHYGQSFRDKEWRTEAACWAAAWSKATARAEAALVEPDSLHAGEPVEARSDEDKARLRKALDAALQRPPTRDEVIRMALKAGFTWEPINNIADPLERFAGLVAAAEREACSHEGWMAASSDCEDRVKAAIRARGQK